MDPIWEKLLEQARAGSMLHPPIGELGSAGWNHHRKDSIPKTLILCDLREPTSMLPPFPKEFEAVEELDLSGNGIESLPENIDILLNLRCLFLGGGNHGRRNRIKSLPPSISKLSNLEHLSCHDTDLQSLPPQLPPLLQTLRIDRCPIKQLPPELPSGLKTLHLEGCPLPGTLERPDLLPGSVTKLYNLEDLQLPDGCHIGLFFGTPVNEFICKVSEQQQQKSSSN